MMRTLRMRAFWRRLAGQVVGVLADVPVFISAPLYRRWHLRWGSTDDEVAAAMAGDAMFPKAQFVATRAITIDAAPPAVWPWLVQVGCGRAGFYSHDLLDNLARPSPLRRPHVGSSEMRPRLSSMGGHRYGGDHGVPGDPGCLA